MDGHSKGVALSSWFASTRAALFSSFRALMRGKSRVIPVWTEFRPAPVAVASTDAQKTDASRRQPPSIYTSAEVQCWETEVWPASRLPRAS